MGLMARHQNGVVKCLHRLPREVLESPAFDTFKTQLDMVLGVQDNQVYVTLP